MGLSCKFSLKPIHWRWHDGKMEGKWVEWYFGRFLIGFCMFFFLNFEDDNGIKGRGLWESIGTGDFPWELAGSWGNLPEVSDNGYWPTSCLWIIPSPTCPPPYEYIEDELGVFDIFIMLTFPNSVNSNQQSQPPIWIIDGIIDNHGHIFESWFDDSSHIPYEGIPPLTVIIQL